MQMVKRIYVYLGWIFDHKVLAFILGINVADLNFKPDISLSFYFFLSFSIALMCMSFTDHKISDFIARQLAFAESKRKSPHYVSECSLCENVGEGYHTHWYEKQVLNTIVAIFNRI